MPRNIDHPHHSLFGGLREPGDEIPLPTGLSLGTDRLEAFERILRRWEPLIFAVSHRLHSDPESAQTACEETFLALFNSRVELREPERHLGDLIAMTIELASCADVAARPVVGTLLRLFPSDREMIVLRFFGGYSEKMIAEMLAVEVDQVRLRLWGAMAAFESVGGRCGDN